MQTSLFIIGILASGFVFGNLARLIVPGSQRLTWSETTLVGIAGAAVGGWLANVAIGDRGPTGFGWDTTVGLLVGSVIVLLVVTLVMKLMGVRQDPPPPTTADLIRAGESHNVEFKQTARWNVHTGERDPKIELVIAKTIAGFLNADGGTLLIGVDDDGRPSGLSSDLSLMKAPDLDRFELWLTDLLERCLGKTAVAHVRVVWEQVQSQDVCRVDVAAAPAPVFLDVPGGNREADMYVRMGNSTRKLRTDEAVEYVRQHW